MAKKDNKSPISGLTSRLMKSVQTSMDNIYKNTYITPPNNRRDLDFIKSDMDKKIDKIINNNIDMVGSSSISKLYNRLNKTDSTPGDGKFMNKVEDIFEDKAITDTLLTNVYNENKYITEYDAEIDLLCRYMPKLLDALDAKKDNVLSADHYSKDFLMVTCPSRTSKDEDEFAENIRNLKKKYKLVETLTDVYDAAAKYGEQFVYIEPYSDALTKLLRAKNNLVQSGIYESSSLEIMNEGKINIKIDTSKLKIFTESSSIESLDNNIINKDMGSINLQLNMSGVLESAVDSYQKIKRVIGSDNKFTHTVDNELQFEGLKKDTSNDGFINTDIKNLDKVDKLKTTGSVFKLLDRDKIFPIYIDNMCLGYYYIEFQSNIINGSNMFTATSSSNAPLTTMMSGKNISDENTNDKVISYIAGKLSNLIDSKFINANLDLTNEIYTMLKANDLLSNKKITDMRATYLSPDCVEHVYFQKDRKTHRGISDLDKAIVPAKFYTSLYVGNTIGILTRGQDKRIYYVKQNVDTNISQTLLNTINQLKKGNYGAREMTNIKTVLNIQGRYNDHVVPVGATGDSPVNFEVMQGQNIDPKTELLQALEEMAISATDVPYEYIQSRQAVEFATRLTMSSNKFMRTVFKRQSIYEESLCRILTKLYNSEYMENVELEVELPPPGFLNLSSTVQMMQNTNEYVQNIIDMEYPQDADEKLKFRFARKLKRYYLNTYLDTDKISQLKKQAEMENAKEDKNGDDNM